MTAPVRLPQAVWVSPETQAAMRDRRMGHLFLCAKKYAGASQARIASATGLHQSEVSRIQQGDRRVIAIDVLERIATGFAMPNPTRLLVGLAPAPASAGGAGGCGHPCPTCCAATAPVFPPTAAPELPALAPRTRARISPPTVPAPDLPNPHGTPHDHRAALAAALLLGAVSACAATLLHAAPGTATAAALLVASLHLLLTLLLDHRTPH